MSETMRSGPAHNRDDSHACNGGPAQTSDGDQDPYGGPAVWNPTLLSDLRAAGEDLADLIEVRKAAENRARTLGHLDTAQICPPWIATAEKAAREALQDAYKRTVPEEIREWAATVPGLGSGELFPRIIAIIGDPCVATPLLPIAKGDTGRGARSQPSGPPYIRSPHQLWQWTGMGDAWSKPREDYLGRKPEQADLLHAGKRSQIPPLLYVWSTTLVKGQRFDSVAESDYWKLLTDRLALTRGHDGPCDAGTGPQPCFATHRKHERQCQNHKRPPARSDGCGISLHPEWGEPGSPWRPGHVQMDANRLVQKKLLMDLWKVAWQLHDERNPATAERRARRDRAVR
jgi:hypothetical protein